MPEGFHGGLLRTASFAEEFDGKCCHHDVVICLHSARINILNFMGDGNYVTVTSHCRVLQNIALPQRRWKLLITQLLTNHPLHKSAKTSLPLIAQQA
jgi:hypothetical protein